MKSGHVLVFATAAITRLLAFAHFGPPDRTYYWRLSDGLLTDGSLVADGALTTAFAPLYPAFLAAARLAAADRLSLVVFVQILFASAGGVYLYALTARLSGDRRAALAAGLLYAVYPYLVRQSVALIEVPVLTTLLIAATYYWTGVRSSRTAIGCGLAFGLLLLTRFTLAPFWLAAIILLGRRQGWRPALAASAVTLALVLPLAARNLAAEQTVVPSRLGENLFVGNCEYSRAFIPEYDVDFLMEYATDAGVRGAAAASGIDTALVTARQIDDAQLAAALDFIGRHPWRSVSQWVSNAVYFFHPRLVPFKPFDPDGRLVFEEGGGVRVEGARVRGALQEIAHALAYTAVLALAVVGLIRRPHHPAEPLLWLLLATTTAVHAPFFPTTRLRAPIDFVAMLYAGGGIAAFVRFPDLGSRAPGPEPQAPFRSASGPRPPASAGIVLMALRRPSAAARRPR